MKRYCAGWLLTLMICALCITPYAFGDVTLSTGARYDIFTDNYSPKTVGYEFTAPVGLTYRWNALMLSVESAFSSANVFPGQGADAEITTVTDTRISASYLVPQPSFGLIFGADLNLPTGTERLRNSQRIAEAGQNHDLFEIDDFGEGLNIGLSVGVAKAIHTLRLSVNTGYWFNGKYDPTRDIEDDDINPGDHIRVSGLLKWQVADWLDLETSLGYSQLFTDRTNGQKTFRAGPKLRLGGSLHLRTRIREPVDLITSFSMTLQDSNTILEGDTLKREPENGNGTEIFGVVELLYHATYRLTLRVLGDVRYYGESPRQDTAQSVPYEGRRLRFAAGPGFIYKPGARLALNGLVKYFVLHQDQDILQPNDSTYRGVNLAVGLTYTF